MMKFESSRSIGTFLENYNNFKDKFGIKFELKDMTEHNWLVHGKKMYWWTTNNLKKDPDFNATLLNVKRFEDYTIIDVESYQSGQKFSIICLNEKMVSKVK